jgi:hypothetical protein
MVSNPGFHTFTSRQGFVIQTLGTIRKTKKGVVIRDNPVPCCGEVFRGRAEFTVSAGPGTVNSLLGTGVVVDLALGAAHEDQVLPSPSQLSPFFLILGIFVGIAESNHLQARRNTYR